MGCNSSTPAASASTSNAPDTTPAAPTNNDPPPDTTTTNAKSLGEQIADLPDSLGKKLTTVGAALNPKLAMSAMIMPNVDKIKQGGHHLRNVFAKPLGDLLGNDMKKLPVHPKSDSERVFIQMALSKNFVFEELTPAELVPLVNAFEKWSVPADTVIIQQGDDAESDYFFYILHEGSCHFTIDGTIVGTAHAGDSFGELALLYTTPRAATVTSSTETTTTTLFRVDQATFRYILQQQTEQGNAEKLKLLQGVDFLKDLDGRQLDKLSEAMTPKRFREGEYLVKKGEAGDYFYILQQGTVQATDIASGAYEDVTLQPGEAFGERALVTGEPRAANIVCLTDGLAFYIHREAFMRILGSYNDLILRSQDLRKLSAIKVLREDAQLDPLTLQSLGKLVQDRDFAAATVLTRENKPGLAALYLVRSGAIEITDRAGTKKTLKEGAYFGDDLLLADQGTRAKDPHKVPAKYTAKVVEDCTVGILTLSRCRRVLDTRYLGTGTPPPRDSLKQRELDPKELKRHKILGAGTFGQVWLVSRKTEGSEQKAYALKIQSKYELCRESQAKAVVYEKNIMAKLDHPFLISLVGAYQDTDFVYMVLDLVQGGELYNVIHGPVVDFLPEVSGTCVEVLCQFGTFGIRLTCFCGLVGKLQKDAKFYAAIIAEGLGYMHRRGYVYRDLKPENVLVNEKGYCVIIDFGFVKYVTSKTYTLCGTPLYLAPEVVSCAHAPRMGNI